MLSVRQYTYYPGDGHSMDEFVSEYRRIYQEGTALFAEFDPCEIHDGKCFQGRSCKDTKSFCCTKCDHLSDTGCTVESLFCKLWICGALRANKVLPKEFKERLNVLIRAAGVICRQHGGRFAITKYIMMYYGKEGYEEFEANESKQSISATASR